MDYDCSPMFYKYQSKPLQIMEMRYCLQFSSRSSPAPGIVTSECKGGWERAIEKRINMSLPNDTLTN